VFDAGGRKDAGDVSQRFSVAEQEQPDHGGNSGPVSGCLQSRPYFSATQRSVGAQSQQFWDTQRGVAGLPQIGPETVDRV